MGLVVKLAVGTSHRDASRSMSLGQVTEGSTRRKEEAKPGNEERDGLRDGTRRGKSEGWRRLEKGPQKRKADRWGWDQAQNKQ